MSLKNTRATDPELAALVDEELLRQEHNIEMIASESTAPLAVMELTGSVFTNKTLEGYPGRRFRAGSHVADKVEQLACERACALYGADHANIQSYSGSTANYTAFASVLKPGDKVLSMRLDQGGHLTHGSPANWVSKIESVLQPIPKMQEHINRKYGSRQEGRLLLKKDSHLAIAGSVKTRGGIYEVLKHTEDLALEHGVLTKGDDYSLLAQESCREFFRNYTIQVGSTGNLGLSIGIMSAAIGYEVIVHMSADAKQWKKDLLRSHGVTVVEYASDYSEAVKHGRELSDQNPMSYFVDDENSRNLFLGYAVAAKRLVGQLEELRVRVDEEHPLFVYIPCGVGGAPGGVSFGLKQVFGDAVHCFFVEPTQAPCMLVGMVTGLNNQISVQDIGLTGLTHADGLAVGRPSGFVGSVMKPHLSGEFTIRDANLYHYMRDLLESEDIFLEPSACAAFQGPIRLNISKEGLAYLEKNDLTGRMANAAHIVWATGGSLVPEKIREEYKRTYLE